MIQSFADKPTERLWNGEKPPELPPSILSTAQRKLTQINSAGRLDDLMIPPGNRLEKLKGDRKGQHSIRINDQFRICFVWNESNASSVEITDYH